MLEVTFDSLYHLLSNFLFHLRRISHSLSTHRVHKCWESKFRWRWRNQSQLYLLILLLNLLLLPQSLQLLLLLIRQQHWHNRLLNLLHIRVPGRNRMLHIMSCLPHIKPRLLYRQSLQLHHRLRIETRLPLQQEHSVPPLYIRYPVQWLQLVSHTRPCLHGLLLPQIRQYLLPQLPLRLLHICSRLLKIKGQLLDPLPLVARRGQQRVKNCTLLLLLHRQCKLPMVLDQRPHLARLFLPLPPEFGLPLHVDDVPLGVDEPALGVHFEHGN